MSTAQSNIEETIPVQYRATIDESILKLLDTCNRYQLNVDTELANSLTKLKHRSESNRLQLAVLGEFNAGKSTFLNRLLKTDILKTAMLPAQAVCTYISYGERDEYVATLKSGQTRRISSDQVAVLSTGEEGASEIDSLQVRFPSPLLADGLVIVDTPGVNVNVEAHGAITETAIDESNACIFLMDARQPGKKTTIEFLRHIHQRVDKFFFVLNRADIYDGDEEQEALDYLRKILTEECGISCPRVFPLSSFFDQSETKWQERFTVFEDELLEFMRKERDMVLCVEIARSFDNAITQADTLLRSHYKLLEREVADLYNTSMPDSSEIIDGIACELGTIISDKQKSLEDNYPAFHEKVCKYLSENLTATVRSATSRSELSSKIPEQLREMFVVTSSEISSYFERPLSSCFTSCQDRMRERVDELFCGIRFVEQKRFLRRLQTWLSVAVGTSATIWGITETSSFKSGVLCIVPTVIVWAIFEWAYFQHVNASRFAGPPLVTLDKALADYGNISSGEGLQKYRESNNLSSFDSPLVVNGARIGVNLARINGPLGIAVAGLSLAAGGAIELAKKAWDFMFGPSLSSLQEEMLGKVKEVFVEYKRNSFKDGKEGIVSLASEVKNVLTGNLTEVASRYSRIIDELASKHKTMMAELKARQSELKSDVDGFRSLRKEIKSIAISLRSALGNSDFATAYLEINEGVLLDEVPLSTTGSAIVFAERLPYEREMLNQLSKRNLISWPSVVVAIAIVALTLVNKEWPLVDVFSGTHWVERDSGLMWTKQDSGNNVSWRDAGTYCHDLRLDGYSNWRLPTGQELAGIYDGGDGKEGLRIKGGISLNGWAWSSDTTERPEGAVYYNFSGTAFSNPIDKGNLIRVLCVRDTGNHASVSQPAVSLTGKSAEAQAASAHLDNLSTQGTTIVADDERWIKWAIEKEGLYEVGSPIDTRDSDGGEMLHLRHVRSSGVNSECDKMFLFVGTKAVWSECYQPGIGDIRTPSPGVFELRTESDGGDLDVKFGWNGERVIRESHVPEDYLCGASGHGCSQEELGRIEKETEQADAAFNKELSRKGNTNGGSESRTMRALGALDSLDEESSVAKKTRKKEALKALEE